MNASEYGKNQSRISLLVLVHLLVHTDLSLVFDQAWGSERNRLPPAKEGLPGFASPWYHE